MFSPFIQEFVSLADEGESSGLRSVDSPGEPKV